MQKLIITNAVIVSAYNGFTVRANIWSETGYHSQIIYVNTDQCSIPTVPKENKLNIIGSFEASLKTTTEEIINVESKTRQFENLYCFANCIACVPPAEGTASSIKCCLTDCSYVGTDKDGNTLIVEEKEFRNGMERKQTFRVSVTDDQKARIDLNTAHKNHLCVIGDFGMCRNDENGIDLLVRADSVK